MTNKIHIGKTIKELLNTQGVSVPDFADKISCTPRNVYKIFSKTDIDTALLARINNALGKNLFLLYLNDSEIMSLNVLTQEKGGLTISSGLVAPSVYLNGPQKRI
jgi:transcriptional regulator with XRE-family HTH domain